MKLLLITAVHAFEKEIKSALKKAKVSSFSYTRVSGYTDPGKLDLDDNWFTSGVGEHDSLLFYAFVFDGLVEAVIKEIDSLNEKEVSHSHIHVSVIDIIKQNKF